MPPMPRASRCAAWSLIVSVLLLVTSAPAAQGAGDRPTPLRPAVDSAIKQRLLALVPEHVSARDVSEVLAHVPAPRIIDLEGSVPIVDMASFAQFLIAMGYPEERVRDPGNGALSYSSALDAKRLAGTLAWYYEHEGMMPMLIGHSQGGMVAIRVLHELAGEFGGPIPVWNPVRGTAETRTAIVDPVSGLQRPVIGLQVPYAAALATGKLPRILLGQWSMLPLLRKIPDTVAEFTGFSLDWDPIAGNFGSAEPYRATGSARVRNVALPPEAGHLTLPLAKELALDPATRAWIDRYVPGTAPPSIPSEPSSERANLLHAADIWYSVKKHWCIEAQRLLLGVQPTATPLQ